jgi:hypothetical protein
MGNCPLGIGVKIGGGVRKGVNGKIKEWRRMRRSEMEVRILGMNWNGLPIICFCIMYQYFCRLLT